MAAKDEEHEQESGDGDDTAEQPSSGGEDSAEQQSSAGDDTAEEQSSGGSSQGESHERLARELDQETGELERRSQDVGKQISETRDDWERKQASQSVPGAVGDPDRGGSSSQSGETETETGNDAGE